MKPTPVHICSKCDAQFIKWSGRCESCGAWGSISKEPTLIGSSADQAKEQITTAPANIRSFSDLNNKPSAATIPTGFQALDEILGGGLTPGSVTLIAGEPGMGKSTLLSQVALAAGQNGKTIIYVAGEESPAQINLRLKRLSKNITANLKYIDATDVNAIATTLEKNHPAFAIIDSVQSISTEQASGETGSISQVKASAAILTQIAKKTDVPIILVGQVTKEGDMAGPRALEHLVDTVLSLEGDRLHRYRLLRAIKHRFGSTDEAALMDMTENGLQIVQDPSAALITERPLKAPGSAIGCVLEGRRPLLVELQALVTPAGYSTPTRRATSLDSTRLNMLLAVLTRHAGIAVYDKDVYANAAGGLGVRDPAADLALAAAVSSAVKKQPLDSKTAYFGEIGLTGELRPVALPELRLKELARMGFTTVVCPKLKKLPVIKNLTIQMCENIGQALL